MTATNVITFNRPDAECDVIKVMNEMGIPAHTKGSLYLREAISVICLHQDDSIDSMMHGLYPYIARKYGTQAQNVERSIRHAIEIAWIRGGALAGRKKPTNSEFISFVTDRLNGRKIV